MGSKYEMQRCHRCGEQIESKELEHNNRLVGAMVCDKCAEKVRKAIQSINKLNK